MRAPAMRVSGLDCRVGVEPLPGHLSSPPGRLSWVNFNPLAGHDAYQGMQARSQLPSLRGQALASLTWPGSPGNSDKSQGRRLGFCILLKFLLRGDKAETSGWILPETHWSPHSMTTITESLSNHSFLIEQGPWTWTSPLAARRRRLQFPNLGVCLFPYNLTPSPPEGYQKSTFPIKLGNWLTGFWKKQVLTLFFLIRQRQTGAFPRPQHYGPASPSAAFSGPESFSHNILKGSLATAFSLEQQTPRCPHSPPCHPSVCSAGLAVWPPHAWGPLTTKKN